MDKKLKNVIFNSKIHIQNYYNFSYAFPCDLFLYGYDVFNIINKEKRIGVHFNKVVDVIRRELVERLYDIENDNFSMYRFWLRRIKRLLPLLIVVVLCTILVIPFFIFKPVVKDVSKDILPAVFSYFNFHALFDFGNYWGGAAKIK